ncbi:hypothetical protein N7471_011425 [Penicillium samsonianum]|uniref:uncharacterized protein n=1 Tax=Penicillium samsonianum TaxID=1882272 RepID=UPI002546C87A|nr:uncharacterized protein N7471_011425 [Penicillium samsonianum]KAJ6124108.1 hypothetical protein N7471_011425 [Penicillium samsonianum]
MPTTNAVLLPKVFPKDLISLGQLIRNPLIPNVDTYTKCCAHVTDDDTTDPNPEEPYKTIVSTDTRGRFNIALTKYLGFKANAQSTNLLSIEAQKLEYRALKNASDVFKRICKDPDVKSWIGEMARYKAPCYFVIGIQVLHDAEFTRAILRGGGGGGYVTVPLEATAQIPLHIEGELGADSFGSGSGKVNGVFGIEVQRLDFHTSSPQEPALKSDVSWHWSYQRVKGTQQEEDKILTIKLKDVEENELSQLIKQYDKDDDEEE